MSIGVGTTKTLAKAANRIAKRTPESREVHRFPEDEPERSRTLESIGIQDVWGIGRRWAAVPGPGHRHRAGPHPGAADGGRRNFHVVAMRPPSSSTVSRARARDRGRTPADPRSVAFVRGDGHRLDGPLGERSPPATAPRRSCARKVVGRGGSRSSSTPTGSARTCRVPRSGTCDSCRTPTSPRSSSAGLSSWGGGSGGRASTTRRRA